MAQDVLVAKMKRCYACIQWEGTRTYNPTAQTIKADQGSEGHCRVLHCKKTGRGSCERFSPLQ